MNNIFNFKEPIFETDLHLVFTESEKQVKKSFKHLKKKHQVKGVYEYFAKLDTYYGKVAIKGNVCVMVINCAAIKQHNLNVLDILVHEVRHVETDFLTNIDVTDTETVARYNEAIFKFARKSYEDYCNEKESRSIAKSNAKLLSKISEKHKFKHLKFKHDIILIKDFSSKLGWFKIVDFCDFAISDITEHNPTENEELAKELETLSDLLKQKL